MVNLFFMRGEEMVLDMRYFKMMLLSSCNILNENLESLSEIDSKFGDGDYGIIIGNISNTIRNNVQGWKGEGIKELLETIGEEIPKGNSGISYVLWSDFFQGLSEAIEDQQEIDDDLLKDMLLAALINMQMRTPARAGDKTMMDVLIPVVNSSRSCLGLIEEVLEAIENSAIIGAEGTKQLSPKFGKARIFGEQAKNIVDPGALAMSLFFQGWNNVIFD